MKLVRLDKAASMPFSAVDKVKLEKLKSRIPSNIRGVIGVMIPNNDNETPVLLGMVIQADPVLRALVTLYDHSSNESQRSHEMTYHGTGQMIKIEGESFANLIESALNEHGAKGKHTAALKSAGNLRNGMLSPVTTLDMDEAAKQPLTSKDRQRLTKLNAAIPENLHGFFMCDLKPSKKNPDKLEINQIILDPNTALQIIGAYTNTHSGHPSRTHIIERKDVKKIADALPNPGQRIS